MVTIQVMTTKQATFKKIKSRGLEKLANVISNMNDTVFVCQRPTPFTLVGF